MKGATMRNDPQAAESAADDLAQVLPAHRLAKLWKLYPQLV